MEALSLVPPAGVFVQTSAAVVMRGGRRRYRAHPWIVNTLVDVGGYRYARQASTQVSTLAIPVRSTSLLYTFHRPYETREKTRLRQMLIAELLLKYSAIIP